MRARRPIVLPNEGFEKCLAEWGKEVSGERSGVYVPAKTQRLEDNEFELPPSWALQPLRYLPSSQVLQVTATVYVQSGVT